MGRPMTPCEGATPLVEDTRIVLGMPHLCPAGLSENWLWKELGHRHWNLIAKVHGRAASGFGVTGEEPVYAAFRRIGMSGGNLGRVGENDVLDLRSQLSRLSATRVGTRHLVGHAGHSVCEVEMESVFVQRRRNGCNRSIARVSLDHVPPSLPRMRVDREVAEPGREEAMRDLGSWTFDPCPSLDFNGAGLLYFSSFVAAVDRAEWRLLGARHRGGTIRERKAVFHGNIEPGEGLAVRLEAGSGDAPSRHHARIRSTVDGRLLADVETLRAP